MRLRLTSDINRNYKRTNTVNSLVQYHSLDQTLSEPDPTRSKTHTNPIAYHSHCADHDSFHCLVPCQPHKWESKAPMQDQAGEAIIEDRHDQLASAVELWTILETL